MTVERIKEIQSKTAYPESVSVQQALLRVWSECEQEKAVKTNDVLEKFAAIIDFIESDLIEVKLYGNDGFDKQEELDGKEYLVKLIKEALAT